MNKKKMNRFGSFLHFFVLVLTSGYILLTLLVWWILPVGQAVIIITLLTVILALYKSVKQKDKKPLQLSYIFYLLFLLVYFVVWGQSDFGTAFIAFFSTLLTPFFLVLNVISYLILVLSKNKR